MNVKRIIDSVLLFWGRIWILRVFYLRKCIGTRYYEFKIIFIYIIYEFIEVIYIRYKNVNILELYFVESEFRCGFFRGFYCRNVFKGVCF